MYIYRSAKQQIGRMLSLKKKTDNNLLKSPKRDDPHILLYDLSSLHDYLVVQKIEKSTNFEFKDWLALANIPWIDKDPFMAIAKKMAKHVKTSKEIRETFLMVETWSNRGHGNFTETISKEIDKESKIDHEVCVDVLKHYQEHPREDEKISPQLKIMIMKKALITSNSLEIFLNSSIARDWENAIKVNLQKIDWPVEKWRAIIDYPIPIKFKIIAQQRIEEIRKAGTNQQLSNQTNF